MIDNNSSDNSSDNSNSDNSSINNHGIIDNTILFYIYYPESSIGSDAIIIEKQMEIALLANLKQINIGLYNISKNEIITIINNIINNAKERLITRYKMEKKHITDLNVNLIYFNDGNLPSILDVLLYTTYFFPKKQEDKKTIKGKYSFVLLNDGYSAIYNKQNNPTIKKEDKIIQTIKNNLNPNIIFTKISFNENVEKLSSTYIRNIAITSNYEKFDNMMMKIGYSKKNSDEILNVIRNSSNVMTMTDIINKTTSMMSTFGANITSKITDMMNDTTNISNTNNITKTNNISNNANYLNKNGNVYYAVYGGYNKQKTRKQTKNQKPKQKTKQKNKKNKTKKNNKIK